MTYNENMFIISLVLLAFQQYISFWNKWICRPVT